MVIYGMEGLTARIQARELLALAAAEVWGISPLPEIARREGGKPYFPAREELCFNLSHSGGLALCALDAAPVGVDIQIVKALRPGLPRRVCSPEELVWLEGQPEFWPSFTLLWALKESRVKQSGQGLTVPIQSIQVPLPPHGPARLNDLHFRTYTGPGWAAAACGHSQPPEALIWVKK